MERDSLRMEDRRLVMACGGIERRQWGEITNANIGQDFVTGACRIGLDETKGSGTGHITDVRAAGHIVDDLPVARSTLWILVRSNPST